VLSGGKINFINEAWFLLICFRYPPTNMKYNILIMNGKAWLQNSEEKNLRKSVENLKNYSNV
jgi:hypothetical protein